MWDGRSETRGIRRHRGVAETAEDCGYRIDLLVARKVVIEIKSVEKLLPIHTAQLVSYLRIGNYPVGLLINFNVVRLIDGLVRRANTRPASPPTA